VTQTNPIVLGLFALDAGVAIAERIREVQGYFFTASEWSRRSAAAVG
jgi:hypothetical protein